MKLVKLYRFVEGGVVYTQTGAAYPIDHNLETYNPYPLGHSEVESKDEMQRANVDVTMALDNPIAQRYLSQPVDNVVTLTIFNKEDDAEPTVFWKGRLATNKPGKGNFVMSFESVFTSMRRPGLRARIQKTCRHVLYGPGCKLDPENFRFNTTVVSASGSAVVVASVNGVPSNTYRGGMIREPGGVVRFIRTQVGTTLTLSRPFEILNDLVFDAIDPVSVGIYRGCAHTETACIEFSNLDNHGGFSRLPIKNPVGGSSIM